MEKGIEVIARYYCKQGYFVEVTHEKSALPGRDYWLCREESVKKMFMFSSTFTNDKKEEHMISKRIGPYIQQYEQSIPKRCFA